MSCLSWKELLHLTNLNFANMKTGDDNSPCED